MKKTIRKIKENGIALIGALVLTGMVAGLTYLIVPKQEINTSNSITKTKTWQPKNIHEICWDAVDTNGDGSCDALVTPHRNSHYGIKGPIYTKGQGCSLGDKVLEFAEELIQYKNDFSRMAGSNKTFYWQCRVDDFNKDGVADKISWPRRNDMPVYETPFSKEVQEKANKVVELENYVFNYIQNNKDK